MTIFKVLNFQNLTIKNAIVYRKPLEETNLKYEDEISIVIIRNPYEYFNQLLYNSIYNHMSPKLSKETLKVIHTLNNEEFLVWFNKLNYHPIINPQTFQLDIRKRIKKTTKNLELFDYVVPYDKLNIFFKNIPSEINIQKDIASNLPFSLEKIKDNELIDKFIGKDMALYEKAQELWKLSKSNGYKSLKLLIERKEEKPKNIYKGMVGIIDEKRVFGWVFNKQHAKCILVGVYKNNILIHKTEANKPRPKLKENSTHPTGLCGFNIVFDEITFNKSDKIEVKTLPDNILLSETNSTRKF